MDQCNKDRVLIRDNQFENFGSWCSLRTGKASWANWNLHLMQVIEPANPQCFFDLTHLREQTCLLGIAVRVDIRCYGETLTSTQFVNNTAQRCEEDADRNRSKIKALEEPIQSYAVMHHRVRTVAHGTHGTHAAPTSRLHNDRALFFQLQGIWQNGVPQPSVKRPLSRPGLPLWQSFSSAETKADEHKNKKSTTDS
ncbi:High-affinity glucose transporter [Fusarium oxysporum f. sp. albedinis]|nr:High-affinity glucose transporter [Fusarium oxysporum f. sp. albedinis]